MFLIYVSNILQLAIILIYGFDLDYYLNIDFIFIFILVLYIKSLIFTLSLKSINSPKIKLYLFEFFL